MSRGFGEFEPIQEQLPEWVAVLIALLTQLGDIWFLALVLAILYWYAIPDQDAIASIGGLWIAGLGLYSGLKDLFAFPRPDEPLLDPSLLPSLIQPLYEATAMASGYGFPSGHAVNATLVYFGLASVLHLGTRHLRYGFAGVVVFIVCFTRVALGVHYLIDVVAGVILGVILLHGATKFLIRHKGDRPTRMFALAIVFSLFFVIASSADIDSILVLGIALGMFVG